MTTLKQAVGAPSNRNWKWTSINWKTVQIGVYRLQMRIAKAFKLGKLNKVKSLQWLLTHSFYAKLLAVKRVTQNRGKNTPGVDKVIWRTSLQKMTAVENLKRRGYRSLPLRRIYIPKKNKKLRPLGIPSIADRAQQALYLLGLEPIAETQADKNSYGFRPKRGAHDAIQQCFNALAKRHSPKWVLEGDIKSCFDEISKEWLISNILVDKRILKQWLDAGYIDKETFYPTKNGTPQGGIISPTAANITLDGLEEVIKQATKREDKVNFVRYADDWICTAATKDLLVKKVAPAVKKFLKERGLELSNEKTKITYINEGFDFLGFNIRKYKEKLLIKPAKKGIKTFLRKIREVIRLRKAAKTDSLIQTLNPKIRGWVNYYRHAVSKKTFGYIDRNIHIALWKWARRRHPNKSTKWVRNKYFTADGLRTQAFFARDGKGKKIFLERAMNTPIERYVKIRAKATPYDPEYKEYLRKRSIIKKKKTQKLGYSQI